MTFNELHYHPTAAQSGGEWIELKNQHAVNVDLSGWRLTDGVDFVFPKDTVIPARGYLVVAANPGALQAEAGISGVLGPYSGQLSNDGERVALQDNSGRVMDEIDYGTDGAWATAADGGGASLAKNAEHSASGAASSWRASRSARGTPGTGNFTAFLPPVRTTLMDANGAWKYRADGADLGTSWKDPAASEAGWSSGAGTFHLGSNALPAPAVAGTALPSGPVTYYFRRTFDYAGQPNYTELKLRLLVDDSAAVYLNGTEITRFNLAPGAQTGTTGLSPQRGAPAWREFVVPTFLLQPTGNVLAVEVHQAAVLPSYAAAVLASGPTAYARLGESPAAPGSARDLADLPGAPEQGAQDGTPQGLTAANLASAGPRPTDSTGGQPLLGFESQNAAPAFQGNSDGGDDVILLPGDGVLNFAANGHKFSAEAWVKGPAAQEDGAAVFAKGTGGGGEQFALDVVSNRFRFFVRDGVNSGTYEAFQHGSLGPNGTWQHVVLTYDAGAGIMRMYVNGVDVGGATPRPTIWNTTAPVGIGARRSANGPYDMNFNGSVDEVALFSRALSAAEVAQHYNAAFAASPSGADTADAVFAAELIATETAPASAPSAIVFNEVSTGGVELMNLGASMSTAGLTVARVTASGLVSEAVPTQSLASGGLQQLTLALESGERLVLFAADGVTVLDSIDVKSTPRSRSPDGSGEWLRPASLTPGAPNNVALNTAVVINEIMFDPPADALFAAGAPRAGKWIELHNRSTAQVDLSGWALADGVGFTFPAGSLLAAGGYLVVAENPSALIATHGLPSAQVFGPWTGNLSGSGERIVLDDAAGNPADRVHYKSGGRWAEASDGGGSSLELRQADVANSSPEAWAASDETNKAAWQTFTWSGVNTPSQPGEPTLWHELDLLLVDGAGEVLIDDVRVTDTTTNANLIQNGDFNVSTGATHWRMLGNHRTSRIEPEPGNAANQVLHVIASGAGEYQGNQIETTFSGNQTLVEGRTYEISLRARWLSGGGRLNTRLYFNRLPRTHTLAVAPNGGTPGAANSRAVANIGPTFANLAHSLVLPAPGQPVVISVDAADPQGVAAISVKYSVGGGAWQSAAMSAAGARFTATLPPQTAGTVVQFYVEAQDAAGAVSTFPARGAASRALYVVNDGQSSALPALRLVMKTADANYLHTAANVLSNEFLGATVIADGGDVYYDVGVRLKGSFVGRNVARVGFNLRFGPDQLFRGVHDKVAVDRSQHTTIGVAEIVAKHIATAAGEIPGMYDDLAYFIHPLGTYTSPAMLRLAGFDEVYLDSQFPNGSEGRMFEVEVHRWSLQTVDGNPESPKLPGNESAGTGYNNLELQDYGNNQEAYRWNALQAMHRDEDDYSALIVVEKMFSQNGAAFAATAGQLLDVESWLRTLAYQSLVGAADAAYTGGAVHNFRLYLRPNDGRMMYLPWDWDSSWQRGTSDSLIGGGNIAKVVTANANLTRRYYAHLYDLVATTYNTTYMAPWTAHYGAVSGQDLSGVLSYIGARANFVTGQLPTGTAFTASAGTVSNNGAVAITGTANIKVVSIEVNGVLYTPVWSSNTAWSIVVPLASGDNELIIRGIDAQGNLVSGTPTTLNVNNPYTHGWPAVKINEWLAENDGAFADPADGDSDDWLELYNPTGAAVNLAGWTLTDLSAASFTIPSGWSIPPGGYLLVWADDESAQNPTTPAASSALHVGFKLSNSGETIRLSAPDGRVIELVAFSSQRANQSEGRLPNGSATIAVLTLPTPASANVLTVLAPVELSPGAATIRFTTTPGIRYTLQWSTDLATWNDVAPEQTATGSELTITDPSPAGPNRFYRVRIVR